MARKQVHQLKRNQDRHARSWAAVGVDTSLTSIAVTGVAYDAVLMRKLSIQWASTRWYPDDDYFLRLGQAADGYNLVLDVLRKLWVIKPDRVYVALEEPWYYSSAKFRQSQWLKQLAEIAGAFKGGLVRYGFPNLYEINNSQWKAVLRRQGAKIESQSKDPRMKWRVKSWAQERYGLPDFPDLVEVAGAKIPRPTQGRGANAKAAQPDDVYDAAAIMAWMEEHVEAL